MTRSRFAMNRFPVRPVVLSFVFVYLAFHVMHGERGLYALFKQVSRKSTLQQQLSETTAKRQQLELKVSHMRNASLDKDLLDEQVRRMLGSVRKNEVIILLDE